MRLAELSQLKRGYVLDEIAVLKQLSQGAANWLVTREASLAGDDATEISRMNQGTRPKLPIPKDPEDFVSFRITIFRASWLSQRVC